MRFRRRRAPLPLRRWLAISLVTVLAIPFLVTTILAFHVFGGASGDESGPAAERLAANVERWRDPAWQEEIRADLADDNISFLLIERGVEVYRSEAEPLLADADRARTIRRLDVRDEESGEIVAVAYLASDAIVGPPEGLRNWIVPLAGLTTLASTLGAVAWFFGRTVVQPLAATSRAARRIAAGNLDVDLPSSRVREVAEVNTAFAAMSEGLQQSIAQQAAMEQERRFFIGAVVHDLRTPLFSLRGYLEGFAKGLADTPEKQARYLTIAQDRTAALERLVSELFDFSRLEYLEQAPHRAPVDPVALIRTTLEAIHPHAETKGLTLRVDVPETSPQIQGDEHLLRRATDNLLDNALRHTPPGGTVTVGWAQHGDEWAITVADSGPGIPPDDLPNLFTPLFRGERSRNRQSGGAGLGLTIAQRIFRAHGGGLSVRNAPDGGAIFTGTIATQLSIGSPSTEPTPASEIAGTAVRMSFAR